MGYGARIVALAVFAAFQGGALRASTCETGLVTVIGDWGRATFAAEIADTPASRAQGLMFVEAMPPMQSMLFVFEAPQRATFWMRNTLIPLDMLFADATGRIVTIHQNAVPLDESVINGGEEILAVLEINGGMAARLGIEPGDLMQHPAFGAAAAAPCDG